MPRDSTRLPASRFSCMNSFKKSTSIWKENNMSQLTATLPVLTAKDFTSDQEIRWCPRCGDYSILAQVKKVLPTLNIPREKFVFVSGIRCSQRFPDHHK